jgi:hypothetical protein
MHILIAPELGYMLITKYCGFVNILILIYAVHWLVLVIILVIKKNGGKWNLGAQPYIGFCRESIALQDALDPSFPVFDLKKCETKEDKIEYSDTHF